MINYSKKIVKCGNLIQIYTFENAVPHGFSKVRIGELGSDDCEYIVEGELYDKLTDEEKQRKRIMIHQMKRKMKNRKKRSLMNL